MINFLKKHWLIILAIVYFIFPIDLIPDIIFPVGFFDDATIIGLGIIREIVMAIIESRKVNSGDKKRVIIEGEEQR